MQDMIVRKSLDIINAVGTLTLPMDVWRIANHYHYRVLNYSHAQELLSELELAEKAMLYPALSAKVFTKYYIFLSDDLNVEEERKAIAHELGHILLGHLEEHGVVVEKEESEQQADLFELLLLAPSPILEQYGINSPADIRQCTGLSMNDSRQIMHYLNQYREFRDEAVDRKSVV